ncbi:hypothetical protein INR75_06755 [Zunongwangia sp. SCSIO 43204]|uniref:hypothetical protein n=1 Tax=Zunongwangia sp. SCSIO 43204 TaxID=2779359 RepID=UPI001CA9DCC5|nr:hypothetical protein [Zunongwangia sp. SCSIO 43204]UAB85707.1 hypothetical protein INR75_06755 [Zunongwangia sp. SCSIO 43204]
MVTIIGTIKKTENEPSFLKRTVHLEMQNDQSAFVEFRGPIMLTVLDQFKIGDQVEIDISFNGHISRRSGQEYNNLVAEKIKKLELQTSI